MAKENYWAIPEAFRVVTEAEIRQALVDCGDAWGNHDLAGCPVDVLPHMAAELLHLRRIGSDKVPVRSVGLPAVVVQRPGTEPRGCGMLLHPGQFFEALIQAAEDCGAPRVEVLIGDARITVQRGADAADWNIDWKLGEQGA